MKRFILLFFISNCTFSQIYTLKIAKLKYNGGGDWYANKTSLPNLINFCNKNLRTNIFPDEDIIEPGDQKIFQYSGCKRLYFLHGTVRHRLFLRGHPLPVNGG